MKKLAALFAALPLAGCISIADAGSLVDVGIIDRSSGQTLEAYRHHGRLYVVGTPGNRYAVMLRNKSSGRVLTVLSVDGINALSGQTAATSQSGYVLVARQSAEISGWRKSMDDVAAFYFTSVADSYAGRTDRPQNVGVIGVAVYREAEPMPPPQVTMQSRERDDAPAADSATSNATPRAAAPARAEASGKLAESQPSRLGTGHGERISAPTQYTEFRRASDQPSEILTIHYDSYSNLLAQGIIPRPRQQPTPNPFPNPFPGGFTPDPRH
ncbi:MAG: hypothetical protein ABTS16_10490 [Candidatus Accumulibacter phosphatis]|jgi:hypothetical protein|uniref:Outer membrane lipoprotein n=2 Tax=Candidatus Accumulibacter TaxID=327159 RepID=A0A080LX84_9PROT|nr:MULTISPECIES: hypothetical protein [Candidatus Accumulibacter]KFB72440.1 MAG: hypothetical protein AW09_002370 [Candidatus Accumulibacter phosphatis]MBL8408057.1 hypothetical protein [Accumulibacter sp.]NMQ05535.1 hypothetical protein [Candidatus Accumulibacter contiguus]HRF12147.1 hypothetical protein [Candidatus Accumulibacter phosphatis]